MDIDALWKKIQHGDEASFKKLYYEFNPRLYQYAFKMLKDHFLAQETVHDVFLKIWQNRQSIFSEGDSLKNYLYRTTHNLCLDTLKKSKTQKAVIFIVISSEEWMSLFEKHYDDDCFAEKIEMDEIGTAIDLMIEKMPKQRREIFKLCKDKGMSNKEIAEKIGLSESSVRTHLQLARKEIDFFKFY